MNTLTAWDIMEAHNIYNVEERPHVQREDFQQEIKPTPAENRLQGPALDFFTPDDQVLETKYLKNDVLDKEGVPHWSENYSDFMSKEQRQVNLNYYTKLITEATNVVSLGAVGKAFHVAVACSTKEGIPNFLPSGGLTMVWAAYKDKKEILSKLNASTVAEFTKLIEEAASAIELGQIGKELFKADIYKKDLWTAYKAKKAAIAA